MVCIFLGFWITHGRLFSRWLHPAPLAPRTQSNARNARDPLPQKRSSERRGRGRVQDRAGRSGRTVQGHKVTERQLRGGPERSGREEWNGAEVERWIIEGGPMTKDQLDAADHFSILCDGESLLFQTRDQTCQTNTGETLGRRPCQPARLNSIRAPHKSDFW